MYPFFSSVSIGHLASSGVTFCITGWVSSMVGHWLELSLGLLFACYKCLLSCGGSSLVISLIC